MAEKELNDLYGLKVTIHIDTYRHLQTLTGPGVHNDGIRDLAQEITTLKRESGVVLRRLKHE